MTAAKKKDKVLLRHGPRYIKCSKWPEDGMERVGLRLKMFENGWFNWLLGSKTGLHWRPARSQCWERQGSSPSLIIASTLSWTSFKQGQSYDAMFAHSWRCTFLSQVLAKRQAVAVSTCCLNIDKCWLEHKPCLFNGHTNDIFQDPWLFSSFFRTMWY